MFNIDRFLVRIGDEREWARVIIKSESYNDNISRCIIKRK